jgi:hypothetical protein
MIGWQQYLSLIEVIAVKQENLWAEILCALFRKNTNIIPVTVGNCAFYKVKSGLFW